MYVWLAIFCNLTKSVEGMLALKNNDAKNISGHKLRYSKFTAQETEWLIGQMPSINSLDRLRIEKELNKLGRSDLPNRIVNVCVN